MKISGITLTAVAIETPSEDNPSIIGAAVIPKWNAIHLQLPTRIAERTLM